MNFRITAFLLALSLTFVGLIGRVGYVTLGDSYNVADSYNSYKLTISQIGQTIFDRNLTPLNNNSQEYVAIIRPNEKCMSELELLFPAYKVREITKELTGGYPVIVPVNTNVKTNYIKITSRIVSNVDTSLRLLVSAQYGGAEKYVKQKVGGKYVNFAVDATGRTLSGECNISRDNYTIEDGVVLTVDKKIQRIAADSAKSLKAGCVVILDVNTSEILACVSKPYDYVNRGFSNYAVGSIFKLVVSAAAIENGIDPLYDCKGSIKVGDTTYSCQKLHKHSKQHIKNALSNSCNCYFVNLALKLGADKIIKQAEKMGFGKDISLMKGWSIKGGFFPSESELKSKGQLALLGFGQGKLTDSPMHFAAVIAAIANGGVYNPPKIISNFKDGGRVMNYSTSKKLQRYMRFVVSDGTGRAADFKSQSAGKTATAQSGQFTDGREILHTYFAGFYPVDKPKYAIVVMDENGTSGAGDCAPLFGHIVEKLENM